jgi:hypothetical protein
MFPAGQLYQPLLFALEGQVNVPKTPVEIGFKSITPLQGGGKGDLRFFFGVKLNVRSKNCVGSSAPKMAKALTVMLTLTRTLKPRRAAPAARERCGQRDTATDHLV